MGAFLRGVFVCAISVLLLAPLPAYAVGVSFGGRVVTVEPCISVLGPSLFVTIVPSGTFPLTYIWTPATITMLAGPPLPGGQIVGVADIPFSCWSIVRGGLFGLFSVFSFSYGLRMQYIGTSPPSLIPELFEVSGFLGV